MDCMDISWSYLLPLLFSFVPTHAAVPSISPIDSPTWVLAHTAIKITCNSTTGPMNWYFGDSLIQPQNTRYQIQDNNSTMYMLKQKLTIENAQPSDSGQYKCEVDRIRAGITVEVLSVITEDGNGTRNGNVSLTCFPDLGRSTYASTLQRIYWTRNGTDISDIPHLRDRAIENTANYSLDIWEFKTSDAGEYECNLEFRIDQSGWNRLSTLRKPVQLYSSPYIYEDHSEKSVSLVQGQKLKLTCNATGHPLPDITWKKGDDMLYHKIDDRIVIGDYTNDNGVIIENGSLIVYDLQFDDRENYTCVATNALGEYSYSLLVRVKDKLAALWPFLAIVAEVVILCLIIFIYEKKKGKELDEEDDDEDEVDAAKTKTDDATDVEATTSAKKKKVPTATLR